jgi:oligopeptide/dipeptide ABC transporter ATP-binding protein
MIYQSPHAHINPVRTVGDFLTEALLYHDRLSREEAERRVVSLLADVGIPDGERRLRQYPHQLSGGLLQRVMIVACLAVEPRLLLADEPTTALDVTTQEEVMAILADVKASRDLAVLLVTHDLDLAAAASDQISVMYAGMIVETADATDLVNDPRHPYTVGLLAARPTLTNRELLRTIPGRPASGFEVGEGCVFAQRCPFVTPLCQQVRPALEAMDGHLVACHRAKELRGAMQYPTSGKADE